MWIPNVIAMAGCFRRSAHQQLARHLAPHDLDLLLRDALGDEAADEHRVAVGLRRVARLPEVRAQNEVLGADLLDVCGRLFVGDLAPVAHPGEVGLRPHKGPHRVDLHLGAHRRGLSHLLGRHVDDLELGMGHHDPVAAGVTRRLDDRQRLGGRRVARAEDELLLGADLPDLAQGWQRLAVGADDKALPALREIGKICAQQKLVLCTGHASPSEALAIVEAARDAGCDRIVVTHSEFEVVNMTTEQMRKAAAMGAKMEIDAMGPLMGPQAHLAWMRHWRQVTYKESATHIKEVGAQHFVLGTDLGQTGNPSQPDGYAMLVAGLMAEGVSKDEIRLMGRETPGKLLMG